eukprot:m.102777 g.102777  ORF g.102777 m.102777 type:complete len:481 (+) comp37183_c1_seq5:179-1621(+)
MENGNIYQGFKGTVLKEFITNFENSENGNCCGEQGLRERDELKAVNEAVTSLYITAMMGEQKERVSNSNRQHLVFLTSKHFEKVLLPYFSPATTATWVESNAIESERRRQYKWKTAVKKEEVCRLKKQFSNQEILKLEYFNFQINAVGIDKFSRCLKQLLQSDEELSDLQNRKRELSKMKLKGVQTTFYNDSKVAITDDSTDCQPPIVLQEHANYYSFFSYSLLFTILLQEVSNRKKVKAWKHLNCGRLDEENSTNNGGVLQDADSERIFSFCSNIGIGGEKINKLEKNGSSHMPSFFPFPLMRGCSEIIAKDEKKQPLNVCNGRNGPVEGESTNQPWTAANWVQDGENPSQESPEEMAPEVFKGRVSWKVDVYAFGMVLYEIASGLPSYSSSKSTDLVMYMKELDEEGVDLEVMIDPRTLHTKGAKEASLKLFDIARACTNMDDKERPQMSSVYNLLQDLHFKFETMQKSTRKDSSDDL